MVYKYDKCGQCRMNATNITYSAKLVEQKLNEKYYSADKH